MSNNIKIFEGDFNNWADIVIKTWKQKLIKYKVGFNSLSTNEKLYNSFVRHVVQSAEGDVARISFLFKEYGIFVDMGVGREMPYSKIGDIGENKDGSKKRRRRKEWLSKALYAEVMKLQEHLSKLIGTQAAKTIIMSLPETITAATGDIKYQSSKK
jgi:hypothetical protein